MLSINTEYVTERVRRYNENPSDDLLYRIGTHADVLEPGESSDGQLSLEQRFRILNWIVDQGYEIKHDVPALIFGKERLDSTYLQNAVHAYNSEPSDIFLDAIGEYIGLLERHEVKGSLTPEQRFRILDWIVEQGFEIKHDLALLIFGKQQLQDWLEISRQAYPDFEFYLVFEFQEKQQSGWDSGINYSVFWHPNPGAPMPSSDTDFPWRLYWDGGDAFWGDFPDNTRNDIEFTLSVYPNQQTFAAPGWVCEEGDRYCSFTDEEADLMPVAEVLKLFAP